jgi:glycosyltransferase involved in cell wall biosynthesis
MRLGVDASWMVGNYRGMGRFARQLIAPVSNDVVALTPRGISTNDWPCVSGGRAFFPWWEQVELPRLCRSERLDFLLCPYNSGPLTSVGSTRLIAVIHDLIYLQPWSVLPPSISAYQTLGRLYRRQVVPAFARRADTILTVSHFTKGELVERFGLPEEDVHVIPNAIADSWFEQPLPLPFRKPYFFTVAGEPPSKNVRGLLKGFALALPELGSEARLKIAGVKAGYHKAFMQLAVELGIAEQVDLLGYVSVEELRQHYREARAFVFASLFEGFGIPLLEAMASGTPVACSNTTSMPEVVGDCGLMFDPRSTEDMAHKLRLVWDDTPEREARAMAAVERARGFSESAVSQRMSAFWSGLS